MSQHFTATVHVSKTVVPEKLPNRIAAEREVIEVGKIVVRADTLPKLIEKTSAHLALVEEN